MIFLDGLGTALPSSFCSFSWGQLYYSRFTFTTLFPFWGNYIYSDHALKTSLITRSGVQPTSRSGWVSLELLGLIKIQEDHGKWEVGGSSNTRREHPVHLPSLGWFEGRDNLLVI